MLGNSQTKHTTLNHPQLLKRLSHAIIRSKDAAFVALVIAQVFGRYINWSVYTSLIFTRPNSSQEWKNKDSSWSPLHVDRAGKVIPSLCSTKVAQCKTQCSLLIKTHMTGASQSTYWPQPITNPTLRDIIGPLKTLLIRAPTTCPLQDQTQKMASLVHSSSLAPLHQLREQPEPLEAQLRPPHCHALQKWSTAAQWQGHSTYLVLGWNQQLLNHHAVPGIGAPVERVGPIRTEGAEAVVFTIYHRKRGWQWGEQKIKKKINTCNFQG